jgi:tetratricopeptide (TPR) repeat protein
MLQLKRTAALGVSVFLSSQVVACQSPDLAHDLARDFFGDTSRENQALKQNPKDVTALYNRAVVRREHGDQQGAIADFTQIIQITCSDSRMCPLEAADAYSQRGQEYERLGEKQKALADYQKSAEIFKQQGNDFYYMILSDIERIQKSVP